MTFFDYISLRFVNSRCQSQLSIKQKRILAAWRVAASRCRLSLRAADVADAVAIVMPDVK